ncbi:MAG: hypothetical protein P1P82_11975 [Bacteroidales bacterium]|nr:hypothetical protein [Bacteroidales bacterium]MDT8431900.1 hypothetical protein [Bacteroidales bacterium]
MSPKKNIPNIIPPKPENPFRVPEGYFDDVQKRVMERIRTEAQEQEEKNSLLVPGTERIPASAEGNNQQSVKTPAPAEGDIQQSVKTPGREVPRGRKIYLQPYLTLAAAISGVALVVYILLQSVTGSTGDTNGYDIATLDRAGVTRDESILAEAYNETGEEEDAAYTEWDEEAITYLASNEVDLIHLLDND